MKKIKVSEASGPALDWLVAKAEGIDVWREPDGVYLNDGGEVGFMYRPSTHWSQGGPIIDLEIYQLLRCQSGSRGPVYWEAARGFEEDADHVVMFGPTLLIAAMRCFVVYRLGDEVEVPEELL